MLRGYEPVYCLCVELRPGPAISAAPVFDNEALTLVAAKDVVDGGGTHVESGSQVLIRPGYPVVRALAAVVEAQYGSAQRQLSFCSFYFLIHTNSLICHVYEIVISMLIDVDK